MVQDDPSKRPTMEQAVERFDSIRQRLSTWKLRSRVTTRDEGHFEHVYYGAAHWRRRIGFVVSRVSAFPPAPRQVPPDFFDNVQDRDPVRYHHSPAVLLNFVSSVLHYRPSDPSLHRRRRVFAPSLGSGPRTLTRLTHFLRRSQPKVDEPTELQQRPGPSTSSHRSPPVVEVPALDDKKVRFAGDMFPMAGVSNFYKALYTARRPERATDKAKRIKNLKLWVRVVLFVCCVPPPTDDSH